MEKMTTGQKYEYLYSISDYFRLRRGVKLVLEEAGLERVPRTFRHPLAARYCGEGIEARIELGSMCIPATPERGFPYDVDRFILSVTWATCSGEKSRELDDKITEYFDLNRKICALRNFVL
jgi:hypothetical protein